jgi:hypothetical protein
MTEDKVLQNKMRITIHIEDYSSDDYKIDFRAEGCANIREVNLAERIRGAVDRILRDSQIRHQTLDKDSRRSMSVLTQIAA